MVCTSRWSVETVTQPTAIGEHGRLAHSHVAAAAVLPHPGWHRHAVAVAEGMHNGGDPHQIVASTREPVPPAMPSRGRLYHRGPVCMIRVRPLFAQLTQFYDPAAVVVVCHPTWNLICGDGRDEPGYARCVSGHNELHDIWQPLTRLL